MTDKIKWIQSQLLVNESASEAASRLNTPMTIDNPTPKSKISTPIDIDKLWGIIPPDQAFKVLNTLIWDRIVRAIEAGNKSLIAKYIGVLVAGDCLTRQAAQEISAALSGEVPDPNWQAKIVTTPAKLAGYAAVSVSEATDAIDTN